AGPTGRGRSKGCRPFGARRDAACPAGPLAPQAARRRTAAAVGAAPPQPSAPHRRSRRRCTASAAGAATGSAAQRPDDLPAEGRQVRRRPGRDDVAVHDHFLVDVRGAGVDDVVADVADAGGPLAFEDAGRSQHPAGVANRGHDFAGVVGFAHDADHVFVDPHVVGRIAAGDDDGVKVSALDVRGFHVDFDGVAPAAGVDVGPAGAHDLHLGAGLLKPKQGVPELEDLVLVFGEDGNALAFQAHPNPSRAMLLRCVGRRMVLRTALIGPGREHAGTCAASTRTAFRARPLRTVSLRRRSREAYYFDKGPCKYLVALSPSPRPGPPTTRSGRTWPRRPGCTWAAGAARPPPGAAAPRRTGPRTARRFRCRW